MPWCLRARACRRKELLKYLHAIENSLGRTREIENGPRTLDLDIVDYQMYVGQT